MIRTVWLGFSFLIVLAGVGAFRFAFGNFDAANASGLARPDGNYIVVAKTVQPASVNTEPLPAPFVLPPPTLVDTYRIDTARVEMPRFDAARSDPARLDTARVNTAKFDTAKAETATEIAKVDVPKVDPKDERGTAEPLPQTLPAPVATGNSGPDWREPAWPEPRQTRSVAIKPKKASEPREKKDPSSARKTTKKDAVLNRDQDAAEPKNCQAEEFEALRFAFKMRTGCWS